MKKPNMRISYAGAAIRGFIRRQITRSMPHSAPQPITDVPKPVATVPAAMRAHLSVVSGDDDAGAAHAEGFGKRIDVGDARSSCSPCRPRVAEQFGRAPGRAWLVDPLPL